MADSDRLVVVTTENQGVFFGLLADGSGLPASVRLVQAQMCVYWSKNMRGVTGLASRGPDSQCKVSGPVPSVILYKVTAVMDATPEAAGAWRGRPWHE